MDAHGNELNTVIRVIAESDADIKGDRVRPARDAGFDTRTFRLECIGRASPHRSRSSTKVPGLMENELRWSMTPTGSIKKSSLLDIDAKAAEIGG